MLFSLLSRRFITRNAFISSAQAFRRAQPSMITRHFAVSRISWAPAAATPRKQTVAKKTPTRKIAKKPAKKQTATKQKTKKVKKAAKPRVAKKVVKKVVKKVKKPAPRIKITAANRAPKIPISSYIRFHLKYFVGVERLDGETGPQYAVRAAREAAASWAALSEAEKKPFIDEAAVAYEEYKKKKEEYASTVNPAVIREINRQRKIKGKQQIHFKNPRYVSSPYFTFIAEERAKIPRITSMEDNRAFIKETGHKWSALPDEEKQRYRELYDENLKARSASK